jgi:DNA-directed RNA polymerase specialized sigma24 family protein
MEFVDARPGLEKVYDRNQACSILVRSIKSLPVALREGSIDETAEILRIAPAAIKSCLFRARNRLGEIRD